mgnify:CR=1 FL=1
MNAKENRNLSNSFTLGSKSKAPVFFIEKAMGWKVYLDKILADDKLIEQLESIDYQKQEIDKHHNILKDLITSLETYHVLVERKKEISRAKNEAINKLNRDYAYHKNLVVNLFNLPRKVIDQTKGPTIQLENNWIKEVKNFYAQLAENESAIHKLKVLNIEAHNLKAQLDALNEIENIVKDLGGINAELNLITEENATKKAAFNNWLKTFKEATKTAFAGNLELMERLS